MDGLPALEAGIESWQWPQRKLAFDHDDDDVERMGCGEVGHADQQPRFSFCLQS